jgi:DNA-binding NarL/FixJ family response regulator
MENEVINIALVEDQPLFRKGVSALFGAQQGMRVVLEAGNGKELLQQVAQAGQFPDVILMDLQMPGMDGMETTKVIREKDSEVKIIILSIYNQDRFIAHMVELGANGYLCKNCEPAEVTDAVTSVVKNGFYFNHSTLQAVQQGLKQRRKKMSLEDARTDLTPREREVLELICLEHTAGEIAEKLFLSVRTVDGHRNNLLLKTGARNTAGLVMYAVKNGIVRMPLL